MKSKRSTRRRGRGRREEGQEKRGREEENRKRGDEDRKEGSRIKKGEEEGEEDLPRSGRKKFVVWVLGIHRIVSICPRGLNSFM